MTYKVWERKLKRGLKSSPKEEQKRVVEYYREMYDEMTSGGRTEESVLAEFGPPEKCARQVMSEESVKRRKVGNVSSERKTRRDFSVARAVGLILFTLLLALPLGAAALGILVSCGALCLAGGVTGVGGIIFAVYYPFSGAVAVLPGVGMGLAASGVGALLFVGFFYATKGVAIALFKTIKAVYARR